MRSFYFLTLAVIFAAPLYAVDERMFPLVRAGIGYGFLTQPDIENVPASPRADIRRGGVSFGGQVLLGSLGTPGLMYGLEAGYLQAYRYRSSPGSARVTVNIVPLAAIIQHDLKSEETGVVPFVQAGIGAAFTQTQTELDVTSSFETTNDALVMAGPGILYKFNSSASAGIIVKYYYLFSGGSHTGMADLSLNVALRLGPDYESAAEPETVPFRPRLEP